MHVSSSALFLHKRSRHIERNIPSHLFPPPLPPLTPVLPLGVALLVFVVIFLFVVFVFIFRHDVLGSTLPTPRSTCVISILCSAFVALFAVGLLRRFLYQLLDIGGLPMHWLLCRTRFTCVTVLYMAFSKTLAYTLMLWFRLGLHKNNVLRKSRCFTQKPCFTQTPCFIHKPCSCWACTIAVCRLQYSSFMFFPYWPAEHAEGG